MRRLWGQLIVVAMGICIMAGEGKAADDAGTEQEQSAKNKALTEERNIIKLQQEIIEAQKGTINSMFPSFGEKFGKAGSVALESGEGDKFHTAIRSAEALRTAAEKIYSAVNAAVPQPVAVALLTDDDMHSVPIYLIASEEVKLLDLQMKEALKKAKSPPPIDKGVTGVPPIYAAGLALSQIAEFARLFRTDRALYFSTPNLPEQVLRDLLEAQAHKPKETSKGVREEKRLSLVTTSQDKVLIPENSEFLKLLESLRNIRSQFSAEELEKNKDLIGHLDEFMSGLLSADDKKFPLLFQVLLGEETKSVMKKAERRVLTVKLLQQGGTTMQTSSIWRSDRLFVSGGVIASYRLSQDGAVIAADVVPASSDMTEVPLKTPGS